MSFQTKNILILGATGLIGAHITRSIVAKKDEFSKISVFTSLNTVKSKSAHIDHLKVQGVEIIVGDLTAAEDVSKAYEGIDTVVSCLGRPAIHLQLQLIDLADKHPDVKRFFPSEYGTDIEYWPSSASEVPHQQKLKVRALMREVQSLEYTYVVTGPYADADPLLYLSAREPEAEITGTFNVQQKRAVLLGDGHGKVSLTTMRDVGKFVAAALLRPEAVRNKAIHVNSFTATPLDILKEFESQTGGASWGYSITSLDDLKRLEAEAYEKKNPMAGVITLRRIWTSGGTLYDQRDNHLLDMEHDVDTLKSAVAQAIEYQLKTS